MPARPAAADLFDLGVPCALAIAAAFATLLPDGSMLRLVLTLAVLLVVPGHLLIAAVTRVPTTIGQRVVRALVALGVSPPLVGLLALATSILPGGFRAASIVAVVTGACLLLGVAAAWRRRAAVSTPIEAGEAVAT